MNIVEYNPILKTLRNIPPNQLDNHVLNTLGVIQKLLSIQDTPKQTKQLPILCSIIKDAAWSLSPKQIIEAFMLYVKCKLSLNGKSLEPISGHLDAIVFGKVIQAYRDQIPVPKPIKIEQPKKTKEEKEKIMLNASYKLFYEYKELGFVTPFNTHIYDFLIEIGKMEVSEELWNTKEKEAKINLLKEKKPISKSKIGKIVFEKMSNTELESETKRILLEQYFESKLK